ncbi:MAG TPA: HEAT repeat domain-containing protein [Bryobacteraceae bacterium]|nr:HEAT repeat domain-containing protein [Bryobacteraceae bacterium]
MRLLLASLLPLLCLAQTPTIGLVEVYGARKIPSATIRKAAGVTMGARLPPSASSVEEELLRIPGVQEASVEAACCEAGKIILYIGIAEKGSDAATYRPDPTEGPEIPEAVTTAYRKFIDEVSEAARAGQAGEDLTQGHSFLQYAPARAVQETFLPLARQFSSELRGVLRTASSEDHRAMAAYVLQYHDDKKSVVEDLTYALQDGDATVRGNAIRALAAIWLYGQRNPNAGISLDPTLLAAMLNSAVWTDRNNAAVALVTMTESRPANALASIRKQALTSLIEMARWRHVPHALPSYILLGRTAGIPETELQSAWAAGEREKIIARASKTQTSPPGRP